MIDPNVTESAMISTKVKSNRPQGFQNSTFVKRAIKPTLDLNINIKRALDFLTHLISLFGSDSLISRADAVLSL
jgi:hypothetical protein